MNTTEYIKELLNYKYPPEMFSEAEKRLRQQIREDKKLYFVIDDDPTGGQTVHDVPVFTRWDAARIRKAFQIGERLVYIMTNSRSLTSCETKKLHMELLAVIRQQSESMGIPYEVISRGDSTLRGHYPLETDIIKTTIRGRVKELLIPMFPEGDRHTVGNIHYLRDGERYIPCGESDYARDKTFGYEQSDLRLWIQERTKGACPAELVGAVPLELIRNFEIEKITKILTAPEYERIVVNAVTYEDLKVFALGYFEAVKKGIRFVARTASAWPKVLGGVEDVPLLTPERLVQKGNKHGGLIIVGSHVKKTTIQLRALEDQHPDLQVIVFNQHLVLEEQLLYEEIKRVAACAGQAMERGRTVLIHTRRERLDLPEASREEQLAITNKISRAVTKLAERINVRPSFMITKGGITSSDILVKAMYTSEAVIMGQIYPGIPVWKLGEGSRYPGMAFVIFPGNVGKDDTLSMMINGLCKSLHTSEEE